MIPTFFENGAINRHHDPITKRPLSESISLLYTNPFTCHQLQYTVTYRWNEKIPDAIENTLLQMGGQDSFFLSHDAKANYLVPQCRKIIESSSNLSVTGIPEIEICTGDNGEIQWRLQVSENTAEKRVCLSVSQVPNDFPRFSVDNLFNFREDVIQNIFKVDLKIPGGLTCIFKPNHDNKSNGPFAREVDAHIRAMDLPHSNQMVAVVVNNRDDPERASVEGMLLEYCSKGNLGKRLRRSRPPIDVATKLKWAAQIAHGIQMLHAVGVVHHDLCCENVVINEDDNAELIDFAKRGYSTAWHAPLDELFDPRQDIYSFGVTLWEIIHDGAYPRKHPRELGIDGRGAEYSPTIMSLIKDCTEEDADDRPSMATVLEVLGGETICGCEVPLSSDDEGYESEEIGD
jgi:Protein tyrosine and serine/threonine kinase